MFLVILVLGLLTIVAAAGVFTIQRGNRQESSPYLEMPGPNVIAQEEQEPVQEGTQVAGASNADSAKDEEVEIAQGTLPAGNAGDDLAAEAGAGKEAAAPLVLNFTDTSKMSWPVRGNVGFGLQHGSNHLFPDSGPVQMQSRNCHPVRSQPACSGLPPMPGCWRLGNNEENRQLREDGPGAADMKAVCGQLKEITGSRKESTWKPGRPSAMYQSPQNIIP